MHHPASRGGFTLLELVVALAVTGLVLLLVSGTSAQQQRALAGAMDAMAGRSELRITASSLAGDLRALSPAAGDIAPGQARDTALQMRGTIATAVVCDTIASRAILASAAAELTVLASYTRVPAVSDTLWALDSSATWRPYAIASVQSVPDGACGMGGPQGAGSAGAERVALSFVDAVPPPPGRPVRITRPVRYSLYKSSDGAWYLGCKDWNTSTHKFNTIQPVSGPFLPASGRGLRFEYLDADGAPLATPVASLARIAAIRLTLRASRPSRSGRAVSDVGLDSLSVLIRLRGAGQE
jgi:prepilin-type N-terminal cleavage/methylation domain-containing protein